MSLSDLEQRIPKSPEQNAEEEHKVNKYEQEEQEENRCCDCIIPSNWEGGGCLLHQSDWREPRRMMMIIVIWNKRRFPSCQ